MPYDGDLLNYCPPGLDFTLTQAVVVSGASWNPCGHMVLCVGTSSANSWYLHVAGQGIKELGGVYAYPKFMREAGYNRYLAENGKREIRRLDAKIKHPTGAYQRLVFLMAAKWWWKVLPDNCATFVKEVVSAGGGDLRVVLNCPDQEVVRRVAEGIKNALEQAAESQKEFRGPKW